MPRILYITTCHSRFHSYESRVVPTQVPLGRIIGERSSSPLIPADNVLLPFWRFQTGLLRASICIARLDRRIFARREQIERVLLTVVMP